ncbi:MAG: DsbC family protein [Pseudohongiellaceae bacterium]
MSSIARLRSVVVALFLLFSPVLLAQSEPTQQQLDQLRERLSLSLQVATANQLRIARLTATAMANIIEVELDTGEILYSSIEGDFVFAGDLFEASDSGLLNLSAQRRQVKNLERIQAIPVEEMIVFSPPETRAVITVFTDVDCQYCRALHRDMEKLMALGIEVRYLAYPRGGEQAASFAKMNSVWCSEDRQKALTQAKNGQNLPQLECDNPVLKHYTIGNSIGIAGTPAILLPDGALVPGYVESDRLAAMLGLAD